MFPSRPGLRFDFGNAEMTVDNCRRIFRGMVQPVSPERRFWLRDWREWRGLTQAALASAISTTPSRVSEVESGSERYNETLLERCAVALNVPSWAIVMGPPPEVLPFLRLREAVPNDRLPEVERLISAFLASIPRPHGQ